MKYSTRAPILSLVLLVPRHCAQPFDKADVSNCARVPEPSVSKTRSYIQKGTLDTIVELCSQRCQEAGEKERSLVSLETGVRVSRLSNPGDCEPFCYGDCPCLEAVAERCRLGSCAGCGFCESTTDQTSDYEVEFPTEDSIDFPTPTPPTSSQTPSPTFPPTLQPPHELEMPATSGECWMYCYFAFTCVAKCVNIPIGAPPQCVTSKSNQCQGQWPGASFSYNGPQCQCQCQGFSFTHTPGQTQVQPSGLLPDLTKIDIDKKSCGTDENNKQEGKADDDDDGDDSECLKMPKLSHSLVLFGPDENLNGKWATYRGDFHTLGTRNDGGQISYYRGVAIKGSAVFPGISIGVDGVSVITGTVTQPQPHKVNWNKGLSTGVSAFKYNLLEWLKWVDDVKDGGRVKVVDNTKKKVTVTAPSNCEYCKDTERKIIVARGDNDIVLSGSKKFGDSIVAPRAHIDASQVWGFVDGFILAKTLYHKGTDDQLHGGRVRC